MSKKSKPRSHYSTVAWYGVNHWLLNGFLLPELAYSAMCDLVNHGRFPSLDMAILEGIKTVLEENAALLVRKDQKWLRLLNNMDEIFKDAKGEKPDTAGAENLRFLNEMYKAREKAESKR